MARQESFDLILMDIHMPGLDGIEAAWRIRKQLGRSTPPIIALTADLFVTAPEETQTNPFDDHLTKPVIAEALEAAMARWTAGDPGSGDVTTESNHDSPGRGQQSGAEATGNPPLPSDLEEQLHNEVLRLHAKLERLRDRPTGQEFQDFAHQLAGLAGLYGLEELATRARKLEQAARSNHPESVAPELQHLGVLVAALPAPAKCDT